jgi:hypothetical protein
LGGLKRRRRTESGHLNHAGYSRVYPVYAATTGECHENHPRHRLAGLILRSCFPDIPPGPKDLGTVGEHLTFWLSQEEHSNGKLGIEKVKF